MAERYRSPAGGIELGGRTYRAGVILPTALARQAGLTAENVLRAGQGGQWVGGRYVPPGGYLPLTSTSEFTSRLYVYADESGQSIYRTAKVAMPPGVTEEELERLFNMRAMELAETVSDYPTDT